jgi:hypothetical protein
MSNYLKIPMLETGLVHGMDISADLSADTTNATPATYTVGTAAGTLAITRSGSPVVLKAAVKLTVVIGGGQTTIGGAGGSITVVDGGEGLASGDVMTIAAAALGASSTTATVGVDAANLNSGSSNWVATRYIPVDDIILTNPSDSNTVVLTGATSMTYTITFGNQFASEEQCAGLVDAQVAKAWSAENSIPVMELSFKPQSIVLA